MLLLCLWCINNGGYLSVYPLFDWEFFMRRFSAEIVSWYHWDKKHTRDTTRISPSAVYLCQFSDSDSLISIKWARIISDYALSMMKKLDLYIFSIAQVKKGLVRKQSPTSKLQEKQLFCRAGRGLSSVLPDTCGPAASSFKMGEHFSGSFLVIKCFNKLRGVHKKRIFYPAESSALLCSVIKMLVTTSKFRKC